MSRLRGAGASLGLDLGLAQALEHGVAHRIVGGEVGVDGHAR